MSDKTLRECTSCHFRQPLEDFRPQGRGHMHVCLTCEAKVKAKREARKPPPDVTDTELGVLMDIRALLKSPRCARCGAAGAKPGNPPYCERCRI